MATDPAIKYEFFVQTQKTTTVDNWAKKNANGLYVFDKGIWRDCALVQERGVEFELLDDAKRFILTHGGNIKQRKLM